MSADRQALLDALREEPDNQTLRLIYADWLEDNGDSDRAEYIRLCLHDSAEQDRHRARLFRRHRKTWGQGMPARVAACLAERGLIQELDITAAAFLKAGPALCGEPLARLRLTAAEGRIGKVLACPALAGVRELTLAGCPLADEDVQALADSPRLARLHTLRLTYCGISAERTAVLAGSPHLGNLRTLDLSHYDRRDSDPNNAPNRNRLPHGPLNQIGDEGLAAIAASPHLGRLETLIVANNWIYRAGAGQLWSTTRLGALHRLDISYNYLHADGVRDLAASPLMKRLTHLEIHANEVGTEGVRALADSPRSRRLKLLDVSGATLYSGGPLLTNEAAEALAGSPHLAGLEHLMLACNRITGQGAAALAKGKLKSLRTLVLSGNRLGALGARSLASSDLLARLERLDLAGCRIPESGALALARLKTAGERLEIDLENNPIGEEAAEALRRRFGERVAFFDDDE
jgi:uncharacterized protein (TIGR02996 family)